MITRKVRSRSCGKRGVPQGSIVFLTRSESDAKNLAKEFGAYVGGFAGGAAGMTAGVLAATLLLPGVGTVFALGFGAADSSGIGELVKAHTTIRNQGGQLKLANLNKRVNDLLQLTRLSAVFDIHKDETSAIESFGPSEAVA